MKEILFLHEVLGGLLKRTCFLPKDYPSDAEGFYEDFKRKVCRFLWLAYLLVLYGFQ